MIINWQNGLANKLHPIFHNDTFKKCENDEEDVEMNNEKLDISNPYWKLDVKHIGKSAQVQSGNVRKNENGIQIGKKLQGMKIF